MASCSAVRRERPPPPSASSSLLLLLLLLPPLSSAPSSSCCSCSLCRMSSICCFSPSVAVMLFSSAAVLSLRWALLGVRGQARPWQGALRRLRAGTPLSLPPVEPLRAPLGVPLVAVQRAVAHVAARADVAGGAVVAPAAACWHMCDRCDGIELAPMGANAGRRAHTSAFSAAQAAKTARALTRRMPRGPVPPPLYVVTGGQRQRGLCWVEVSRRLLPAAEPAALWLGRGASQLISGPLGTATAV